MANRGKTHNEEVYCIKDLERLGSSKMQKAYRGMLAIYLDGEFSTWLNQPLDCLMAE